MDECVGGSLLIYWRTTRPPLINLRGYPHTSLKSFLAWAAGFLLHAHVINTCTCDYWMYMSLTIFAAADRRAAKPVHPKVWCNSIFLSHFHTAVATFSSISISSQNQFSAKPENISESDKNPVCKQENNCGTLYLPIFTIFGWGMDFPIHRFPAKC